MDDRLHAAASRPVGRRNRVRGRFEGAHVLAIASRPSLPTSAGHAHLEEANALDRPISIAIVATSRAMTTQGSRRGRVPMRCDRLPHRRDRVEERGHEDPSARGSACLVRSAGRDAGVVGRAELHHQEDQREDDARQCDGAGRDRRVDRGGLRGRHRGDEARNACSSRRGTVNRLSMRLRHTTPGCPEPQVVCLQGRPSLPSLAFRAARTRRQY